MDTAALQPPTARRRPCAVAIGLALAVLGGGGPLAAQDGSLQDFDLRPRASPTPQPPVVGPDDPENPTVRPRPRVEPTARLPGEVPRAASPPPAGPAPAATQGAGARSSPPRGAPPATQLRPPEGAGTSRDERSTKPSDQQPPPAGSSAPRAGATTTGAGGDPAAAARPPAASVRRGAYVPRRLDAVEEPGSGLGWLLLAALGALVAATATWLAWSRHYRHRPRAASAPEIERPSVPSESALPPAPAQPPGVPVPSTAPAASEAPALALALHATRMSATLVNATLSYRLAVTNNGAAPLHDVIVAGDMIGAHASRPAEELLGAAGVTLPVLHQLPALAPGESAELRGDIRLPLAAITPIRRGDAALFVPLARLRARGDAPDGTTVEGGGTFLVGQEPGANARLQPFRLDLGPRNYSQIGQQLLPVPA